MGKITDIRAVKRELRARYRAIREGFSPTQKQSYDEAITEQIKALPLYRQAGTLLCFVPTPIEVDTTMLIRHALEQGKQVAVPKCLDDQGNMDFFLISSLEELTPQRFGLLEPDPEKHQKLTDFRRSVCILPGFAFDTEGYRIGFGKGYYDRFLRRYRGTRLAVCYNECITDHLPRGRFDLPADYIVTPKYILTVSKKPQGGKNSHA